MFALGFIIGLLFVAWIVACIAGWYLPFTDGLYLAWCIVWAGLFSLSGLAQIVITDRR